MGIAISSSVRDNSTAFGFSIMITLSFGTLVHTEGQPRTIEILTFALAAPLAIAVWEGAVTRGFRERVGSVPSEVTMLGTAMNFVSVAIAVSVVLLTAELVSGLAAWPVGAFTGATTYILAESAEILLAETIQATRGDPQADQPQDA